MANIDLSNAAAVAGILSAGFWFYSAISISREKELARRQKLANKTGEKADLGGVQITDGDHKYDLIATLRHQAKWSKWGAAFAAIALILQAADKYF